MNERISAVAKGIFSIAVILLWKKSYNSGATNSRRLVYQEKSI